jgi:hypothetical protein
MLKAIDRVCMLIHENGLRDCGNGVHPRKCRTKGLSR